MKDNTNRRSLVAFENLPNTCCVIKSAKMYLYYLNVPRSAFQSISDAPFIPRYLQVDQVKKHWNETQATSRRQFLGVGLAQFYRNDWQTEYLGLDGTDADPLPQGVSVPIFPFRPAGWVEFDITREVVSWKGGSANHGLLIRDVYESRGGGEEKLLLPAKNIPMVTSIPSFACSVHEERASISCIPHQDNFRSGA